LDQKKIGGASPGKSNKILSEKKKNYLKNYFFCFFGSERQNSLISRRQKTLEIVQIRCQNMSFSSQTGCFWSQIQLL
jgi:hypothetical protein